MVFFRIKNLKFLFFCFVFISFVINIYLSALVHSCCNKKEEIPAILENSYDVHFSNCLVKNEDIFCFLESYCDDIVIFKRSGGIYFNKRLHPGLVKVFDKLITRQDIKEQKNLILKNNKKSQVNQSDYVISTEYVLSGHFENENLPRIVYTLFPKNANELFSLNDGFTIWSQKDTLKFLNDLRDFLNSKQGSENAKATVIKNPTGIEIFFSTLRENFSLIVVSFLVFFLLLLNSLNSTKYWLEKQKMMLGVKRLGGASKNKIFLEVLMKYFLTLTVSFLTGSIGFLLVGNLDFFKSKGVNFFTSSFLISYFFLLMFGIFIAIPILIKYCKIPIKTMLNND
ncbi:MAG: hypothetical protein LBT82_00555 [Oscillospiraceae bacterium]|nr:hypothetical protein [Oscillospiraceae bacterium]